MCGIAGIVNFNGAAPDRHRLAAMIRRIAYRGPDADGVWCGRHVGFAHARLSLVDLARGAQPMCSDDGALVVTFNGEIYNHDELRASLKRRGHVFRTRSDTEVILHAYQEFGDRCVEHFNGQWAFALWDGRARRVVLSRDRFGIRPLYYTHNGNRFLFASEVKALFVCPDVPRALDPAGINEVLTFWAARAPRTVFRGIEQLPPGHNMLIHDGVVRTHAYWQLGFSVVTDMAPTAQCDRVAELFADATRLRLRADVPVGAYISGGLDSTLTAVWAQRYAGTGLKTFSIAFDSPEHDERHHQAAVAGCLGTTHETLCCRHADIAAAFPQVVFHAETPLLRTAATPLYLLSRRVRAAGIKAVLTGEGADELFAGYGIFKEAKVRRFIARGSGSAARSVLIDSLYHYLPHLRAQSRAVRLAFFRGRPEDAPDPLFSHLPRWRMTAQLKRLLQPEFLPVERYEEPLADLRRDLPASFGQWPKLAQAQFLEATVLMPGYILASQGDRVAMAHAVEGRFPFLDHRLAEFAIQLPSYMRLCGLDEKHILKRALGHAVPPAVRNRTKQPFRAPDAAAFFSDRTRNARADYVDELLSPRRVRENGVFRPTAVTDLVRKTRHGRPLGTRDNMALVAVLSTQLLCDQLLRQRPVQHPQLAPPACTSLDTEPTYNPELLS